MEWRAILLLIFWQQLFALSTSRKHPDDRWTRHPDERHFSRFHRPFRPRGGGSHHWEHASEEGEDRDGGEGGGGRDPCPQCQVCPVVEGTGTVGSEDTDSYNPYLQAKSLAEAVLNFPDLSQQSLEGTPSSYPAPLRNEFLPQTRNVLGNSRKKENGIKSLKCDSPSCRACATVMLKQLMRQGIVDERTGNSTIHELTGGSSVNELLCRGKYRFQQPRIQKSVPYTSESKPGTTRDKGSCDIETAVEMEKRKLFHKTESVTLTRNSAPAAPTYIGSRSDIFCLKKGEVEKEEGNEWIVPCDICWSWRVLPPEYSPQYLNELVCNSAGHGNCLSGYGSCNERKTRLPVMKNLGTASNFLWNRVEMPVSVSCECKASAGSPITSLFVG